MKKLIGFLEKISGSPSGTVLAWAGAFLAGLGASTCIFPIARRPLALSACLSSLLLAVAGAVVIKRKGVRLLAVAGFCFACGFSRYLSAEQGGVDLISRFPALVSAKAWLISGIDRLLPEPQAGFVEGLLVGSGLRSPEIKAAFVATGTAHVMALSGYNITVVGRCLERALEAARFGRRARWLGASAGLAAFVVMAGASASLVRAAVMAALATVGLACGRRADQARLIVYASAVMLAVSPGLLRTDIGFLLSVSATLGLIYLSPAIEPFAAWLPQRFGIARTCAETAAATLATLPICLAAFGQASLVALPANLLLLPFIPATMATGFAGAVLSAAVPAAARWAAPAAAVFAGYDLSLVKLLSRLPGASVSNIFVSPAAAALMAAAIAFAAFKINVQLQQKAIS